MRCLQIAPPLASRTHFSSDAHCFVIQGSAAVATHCAVPVVSSSHVSPGGHCSTAHGSLIVIAIHSALVLPGTTWHFSSARQVTPTQGSTMRCLQIAPPLASRTHFSSDAHCFVIQGSAAVATHCAVPVVSSSHVSPGGHCSTAHGSLIVIAIHSALVLPGTTWHFSSARQVTPAQGSTMRCLQIAPPLASRTHFSSDAHCNKRQGSLAVRTQLAVPLVSSSHVFPVEHRTTAQGSLCIIRTQ